MSQLRLAVFVSGRGSNLVAIFDAISRGNLHAEICLILSSKQDAPALDFGKKHGIKTCVIPSQKDGAEVRTRFILNALHDASATFVALAGYMHLLESDVVKAYENRIVNIHPALLPAFGGKGMYGQHVHKAVIASGAKLSGATVHFVDEVYDRGPIIAQRAVPVLQSDTVESLAGRVLKAEHSLYPEVLQLFAENCIEIKEHKTIIHGETPEIFLK